MKTIEEALEQLENGQSTREDLELLTKFVERADRHLNASAHRMGGVTEQALVLAVTAISSARDIDQIAHVALSEIAGLIPADSYALFSWEQNADRLVLYSEKNMGDREPFFHWQQSVPLETVPFLRPVLQENRVLELTQADRDIGNNGTLFLRDVGAKKLLGVPVSVRGQPTGMVVLLFQQAGQTSGADEVISLRLLANQTGVSIENAHLIGDARQRSRELEALHHASLTLTASLDLRQVFNAILQSTLNLMRDAEGAHIFLYEEGTLNFAGSLWSDGRYDLLKSPPRKEGLTYTVAHLGEIIQVADMTDHPLYQNAPEGWHGSIVGLPLKIETRVVGVMNVARTQVGGFNESEMRVLHLLADQAALAIENARLHNVISQQALTDVLTDLPNRRFFDRRLAEEISRSNRYNHRFALIMIDLNHFKEINDTFGHRTGDQVLHQVGGLLRASLHDTDFLARYGGDEFALILPETNADGAQSLATRLQDLLLAKEFELPIGQVRCISACFGPAVYPDDADTAEELVETADRLLYEEKRQQGGR